MVFETERLEMREWDSANIEDIEAGFAIYSDPEVVEFIRDGETIDSLEEQLDYMLRTEERYRSYGGFPYGRWAMVDKESREIVGTIILQPLPGWNYVEVGWHLARRAWGKGYATEAARKCISHAFENLPIDQIVAVVDPRNKRSLAVANRLGMQDEGMIIAYELDLVFFTQKRV